MQNAAHWTAFCIFKLLIKQLALGAMSMMPLMSVAQDEVRATVQADFVSHYMWRGEDRGGFSIQPMGKLTWQGASFQVIGSTGLEKDDHHEIDIRLGYEYEGFNVGLTDYWQTGVDPEDRYFFFDQRKTGHQVEANVGYTCKYFTAQAYTMVWGNDFKKDGARAFSTFVELGVPFNLGGLEWLATVGFTPMESAGYYETKPITTDYGTLEAKIPHYFYAEGFAFNSASVRATKNLFLGDVRVPVFAELHANPYLQTARLVLGIGIIPLK